MSSLAAVYHDCLVRALDDRAFDRLCSRQSGSLLKVAHAHAGYEKVDLDSVPLNKEVLEEFAKVNPDMQALDKGTLMKAFVMLDVQHSNRLSGAKYKKNTVGLGKGRGRETEALVQVLQAVLGKVAWLEEPCCTRHEVGSG